MLLRKGFGLIKPFLINFFTMNVTPKSRIRHFSTWLDVPEKVVPSPLPQQHPMLSSLLAQPIYFHRKVEKVMAYHDLAEAVQAVLGDNITKAEAYKWVQYLKFFRKQNFVGDIMWTHLTPQQWVRKSLDHYCPHFKSWKSPTAVHDNIKTSEETKWMDAVWWSQHYANLKPEKALALFQQVQTRNNQLRSADGFLSCILEDPQGKNHDFNHPMSSTKPVLYSTGILQQGLHWASFRDPDASTPRKLTTINVKRQDLDQLKILRFSPDSQGFEAWKKCVVTHRAPSKDLKESKETKDYDAIEGPCASGWINWFGTRAGHREDLDMQVTTNNQLLAVGHQFCAISDKAVQLFRNSPARTFVIYYF